MNHAKEELIRAAIALAEQCVREHPAEDRRDTNVMFISCGSLATEDMLLDLADGKDLSAEIASIRENRKRKEELRAEREKKQVERSRVRQRYVDARAAIGQVIARGT